MSNDFFTWHLSTYRDLDALPALTDADYDALFRLFDEAGLPSTAMTVEMADGYLTAGAVGPEPPMVHEFLEGIFGRATLPICADAQQQEQLLVLLLRRYREISSAVCLRPPHITPNNMFLPLVHEINRQDCISPYQVDANDERLGDWKYKHWAEGFRRAITSDPQWHALMDNPETSSHVIPVVLFSTGYNPDQRHFQIDNNADLEALLVTMPYRLHQFWRDFNRQHNDETFGPAYPASYQEPYQREAPKVGRNDPCPCGSGKKYKKCCGA
jgi:uncharacterized protein